MCSTLGGSSPNSTWNIRSINRGTVKYAGDVRRRDCVWIKNSKNGCSSCSRSPAVPVTDNMTNDRNSNCGDYDHHNNDGDRDSGINDNTAIIMTDPSTPDSEQHIILATGVTCGPGMTHGRHYCEISFTEPLLESSIMFGLSTGGQSLLSTSVNTMNLVGSSSESWGLSHKGGLYHGGKQQRKHYCPSFFKSGTVIGCLLDFYNDTVTYYKDGSCLGVAFTREDNISSGEPLYFTVSSNGESTEVQLNCVIHQYGDLTEMTAARVLKLLKHQQTSHDIVKLKLGLPTALMRYIVELNELKPRV